MKLPPLEQQTRAAALKKVREAGYKITALLGDPTSNPKVAKNKTKGVLTAPLHLAPYDLSGYQVCAFATEGCSNACLHTAGNPVYMSAKEKSRVLKTKLYFEHRDLFLSLLIEDIKSHIKRAERQGMLPGVRLNATSDIPWERVSYRYDGINYSSIMEQFPNVVFYDYTKRPNRRNLPDNYSLTFSLAEDNDEAALEALKNGMNVAVVFHTKRGQDLPKYYSLNGKVTEVIDGDLHDYRPADPKSVIVGLRAKGDAIGDTSGFVRYANVDEFDPPSLDTREYEILNNFDQYWEETCA